VASKAAVAKGISPILATANMEESILFYQSVLGFRSTLKSADYSIAERDGQTVHFQKDVVKFPAFRPCRGT
jgi:catechol 2,3-dioxygenase-like lactoylglutathione lyase family enzyme